MPLYPPPVFKFTPSYMVFAGHSFFNQAGGIFDQAYRLDQAAMGLLGIPREGAIVRAETGSTLCLDSKSKYGYCNFLQNTTRSNTSSPYVGSTGAYCFCYGINDMGLLIPSSDYPAGTVQAQVKNALQHAWRTVISRARASAIFECGGSDESNKWSFGAGMTNSAANFWNSGGGYRSATSTTNATATFTIPADFPGGTIAVGFIGAFGTAGQSGAGGTWTVGGTFSGTGGANIVTSNLMPLASGSRGHYIRRFTGLPASDAGKTMIFTVSAVDASGTVGIDYAQIEAVTDIPLVVMCNISRLVAASNYVANWSGSYWTNASNLGATGDADVASFNAALASVVAEFDQYVVVADIDKALGKSTAFINSSDGLHPNSAGCLTGGQAIWNAISTAPTSYNNLVPDWRIAAGNRRPRLSQCWYGPEVAGGYTSTTVTMATGTMYLYPIIVSEASEIWDQVAFEVTTAGVGGAPTVFLGVYTDEAWSGKPQCPPFGTGSQAITSTGVKTVSVNWILDPGLYWLAFDLELQGSTTPGAVRGFTGQMPLVPQSTSSPPTIGTWAGNTAYQVTGVNTGFGFLPGDLGSATPSVVATAAPLMLIRRK